MLRPLSLYTYICIYTYTYIHTQRLMHVKLETLTAHEEVIAQKILVGIQFYTEATRGVCVTWIIRNGYCYNQSQACKSVQCTSLSQWKVIPGIVDTQYRLVVGGNTSLWRRALVQGAVLCFAEGQEHTMLKILEKNQKSSKMRANAQSRAKQKTGKSIPR